MGAWGTGISSNDTTADIYDQFIEFYNDGYTPEEISAFLIRENQELIEIAEDSSNFWFALAKAQWECKALDPDILNRVRQIIESGSDTSAWRELGATSSDVRARQKVLNKFLKKLGTEKANPRTRKKKRYFDSVYRKGDCLVYPMDNGNYGGAFVLTDESHTEAGVNYIAITTLNCPQKPTLEDFANAEVFVRWAEIISVKGTAVTKRWMDEPQIGGIMAVASKQRTFEIEVVGNLPMYKEYSVERSYYFGWRALQIIVPTREEYEFKNGKPKSKLMLSNWTRNL